MQEIKPLSLKLKVSVREEIRSVAIPMGYTEHGFIVESVKAILRMIQTHDINIPSIVITAWCISEYARNPSPLHVPESFREWIKASGVFPSNSSIKRNPAENAEKQKVQDKQIIQTPEISNRKNRKYIGK